MAVIVTGAVVITLMVIGALADPAPSSNTVEVDAMSALSPEERVKREGVIMAPIRARRDEVENVTWHYARNSESWRRFAVYAYVGEKEGQYWLRTRFGTRTDGWIFWDRIIFNVDGTPREIAVSRWDKEDEVEYGGNVRETLDISGDKVRDVLNAIAAGEQVTVRFRGSQYHEDYTVPASDLQNLRDILAFYDWKVQGVQ